MIFPWCIYTSFHGDFVPLVWISFWIPFIFATSFPRDPVTEGPACRLSPSLDWQSDLRKGTSPYTHYSHCTCTHTHTHTSTVPHTTHTHSKCAVCVLCVNSVCSVLCAVCVSCVVCGTVDVQCVCNVYLLPFTIYISHTTHTAHTMQYSHYSHSLPHINSAHTTHYMCVLHVYCVYAVCVCVCGVWVVCDMCMVNGRRHTYHTHMHNNNLHATLLLTHYTAHTHYTLNSTLLTHCAHCMCVQ